MHFRRTTQPYDFGEQTIFCLSYIGRNGKQYRQALRVYTPTEETKRFWMSPHRRLEVFRLLVKGARRFRTCRGQLRYYLRIAKLRLSLIFP